MNIIFHGTYYLILTGFIYPIESFFNSALDLDYRDLRNLDPNLASSLLDEIKLGADLGPILEKIRESSFSKKPPTTSTKETKSVTFEDETK